MGMADLSHAVMQTLCCGTIHLRKDVEPLPGGRREGNHMFDIVKCPNPYCPTNKEARDAAE